MKLKEGPLPGVPARVQASMTYTDRPDPSAFRMHSHTSYEIYCFLEGQACYRVEGTGYDLAPGDVMLMAPGEVHHVTFSGDRPYRRIVVNFPDLSPLPESLQQIYLRAFHDRNAGEFNHYAATAFPSENFRAALERIVAANGALERYTLLLSLLLDLSRAFRELRRLPSAPGSGARILSYIASHLREELSLDLIAGQFFLSKSQLSRIVKAETGATVWTYVTTKRLFLARTLIQSGVPPTEALDRSGFREYSTFYRAYKKHFGESPKHTALKSVRK